MTTTTTNQETTVKTKATKCKMCGKRRQCTPEGLCKMECAKEMLEQQEKDMAAKAEEMPGHDPNELAALDAEAQEEHNKEDENMKKIRKLVDHLRVTLAHMREKTEFAKQVKEAGNNPQLLAALTSSYKALLGEAKLELALYNRCTKRRVEVVAISSPHSSGWSVEMQLPDLTNHLVLRTFRYKQVLDVTADKKAKVIQNRAAWKYFSAEEVDNTYWTEVK